MVNPRFPHAPLEFYGVSIFAGKPAPTSEECPFLKEVGITKRCDKIRKSERDASGLPVTLGTCIAEQAGKPVILSPWRMYQGLHIFRDAASNISGASGIIVLPELNTPGGSVDYAVVGIDSAGKPTDKIVGLEIQTMDTTGSMYEAKIDWFQTGRIGKRYDYGMNWAHIAKLTLVQAHNKAPYFAAANRKYIWAIQDVLLDYLRQRYDLSQFHPETVEDVFCFYTYRIEFTNNEFVLAPDQRVGTDLSGLAKTLAWSNDNFDLYQAVVDAHERSSRAFRITF